MSDIRTKILNADDITHEDVTVPEWDVTIRVKAMTGQERADMLQSTIGPDGKPQIERIYPEIVIACAADPESGEKVFEPTDRDILNTKSAKATERIAKVAMRLSGINEDSAEAAKNA